MSGQDRSGRVWELPAGCPGAPSNLAWTAGASKVRWPDGHYLPKVWITRSQFASGPFRLGLHTTPGALREGTANHSSPGALSKGMTGGINIKHL